MNRAEKAVVIDEIAANIHDSQAIFAVDFRGITVPQAAELRDKLRALDASFRVVKNSLTERAADQAGAEQLKELLTGPTALTFVRGDAATAAKAIADYARVTQKLAFKGGVMDGLTLTPEQVTQISRLLSREALYGQLVGLVASPLTGLVRTLNALISGLAIGLAGVLEKKESGEIPAGEPPAAMTAAAAPAAEEAPAEEAPAEEAPAEEARPVEAPAEEARPVEAPAEDSPASAEEPPPAAPPVAEVATAEAPVVDAIPTDVTEEPVPVAEEAPAPPAAAEETPPPPTGDGAAATSPETPQAATPPQDSGDEVAGAQAAQTDEAQAEEVPAAEAPATEEAPSHKEND